MGAEARRNGTNEFYLAFRCFYWMVLRHLTILSKSVHPTIIYIWHFRIETKSLEMKPNRFGKVRCFEYRNASLSHKHFIHKEYWFTGLLRIVIIYRKRNNKDRRRFVSELNMRAETNKSTRTNAQVIRIKWNKTSVSPYQSMQSGRLPSKFSFFVLHLVRCTREFISNGWLR